MDSCYHPNVVNCVRNPDNSGFEDYECCIQKSKAKPVFGMWVKKGTCDKSRGICTSGKQPSQKFVSETYTMDQRENYEMSSGEKNTLYIVGIVAVILALMLLYVLLGRKSKRRGGRR